MPSEFELISRYFTPPTRHTVLGGGDDAALVAVTAGMELVVSSDMLVGGRHFFENADPYGVGNKCLAVNLSDIAAMGARPRWVTLSIALPHADESWIEPFSRGFLDLAREHDVDLIGGDTTRGPLTVCVQILGEVPAGEALRRDGAIPDDEVWVSGTVGDAAIALAHLRGEFKLQTGESDYVLGRLHRPSARVALGQALRGMASSAIDISDGLVADIGHIAERSQVRIVLKWDAVPLSSVGQRLRDQPLIRDCALTGGDDYELGFTAARERHDALMALSSALGIPLTPVGRVEAGTGVTVLDALAKPIVLERAGFDHFR
jgi:thiamine-monophosphate kinase